MKNLKELNALLFSGVQAQMIKYGFKGPKNQWFIKKTSIGENKFCINTIWHQPVDFDVTVSMGIQIPEIQELVMRFENTPIISKTGPVVVIGSELGNYVLGKQKRWTIATIADVDSATIDICDAFRDLVVPFYESFNSLPKILDVLSENNQIGSDLCPFNVYRCRYAVALAYLLRDFNKAEHLIQQNDSFLKNNDSAQQHLRYQTFVDGIRKLIQINS